MTQAIEVGKAENDNEIEKNGKNEMVLQDLPAEIFFRIIMYLPAMDLIVNATRVNAYWRSFSTDECLWKFHCLSRWGYWKHTQDQIDNPDISWFNFFKANCIKSGLSFLVLGAEGGGEKDERLFDVQSKLKLGGLVNVDVYNIRAHTPSPDLLKGYNGVLFFSYHGFDQASLGNMLADFVEMGGGVVFCAYGNCGRGNRLEGKWAARKLDPLTLGSTSRTPYLTIGKRYSRHPVLDGVTEFDGGEQSSHGDGPAHQDATMIAEWTNGRPLAVELSTGSKGAIIGLNMYPPSSDAASGGWKASTQGARLMANALHYVAGGSVSSFR